MTIHNVPNILTRLTGKLRATLAAALPAALLMAGLSACDDKNEPGPSMPQLPEGRTFISVLVAADAPAARTADDGAVKWGDNYFNQQGNDFENHIRQERVHLAILKADGSPVAVSPSGVPLGNYYTADGDDDMLILPLPGQSNMFYAYLDVTDLKLQKGQDYVVAVTANYYDDSRPVISQISNSTFSLDSLINVKGGGGKDPLDYYHGAIPMFGLLRWTFGDYAEPDGYFDASSIGTVHMLRSVCKIEVLLPSEEDSPIAKNLSFDESLPPHLAGVSGTHLNAKGMITPQRNKWLATGIKSVKDITFANTYNELRSRWVSQVYDDKSYYLPGMIKDKNGKTTGYYIYLPEASAATMAPQVDPLRLNVTVTFTPDKGDTSKRKRTVTGTLFPSIPYDEVNQCYPVGTDFEAWKLVRNHIYRFIITDIADETSLEYRVNQPGQQIVNVPDFD